MAEGRNDLLRSVDWRFLLRQAERPRTLDLTASKRYSEALRLVGEEAGADPGAADLVVLGFPTRRGLRRARAALRPGGEVVCIWRLPRLAGVQRARARLRRAGLEGASFYWPGPRPFGKPDFWLPLDLPGGAVARFLAWQSGRSPAQLAQRMLWRLARRAGVLAPACAVARTGGGPGESRIDALLAAKDSLALLTYGVSAGNKVVCLPLSAESEPELVVKFARIPVGDRSLDREEEILSKLADDRPGQGLGPLPLAGGRRAGRRASVQSVMPGTPPLPLTWPTFEPLALRVTARLVELAGDRARPPAAGAAPSLVERLLEEFEARLPNALEPGALALARHALAELPDLPSTWEHRDCGAWNIHVDASGAIGFVDWGGATDRGLPGLDLAHFLATAGLMLEGAILTDPPDPKVVERVQGRLDDPATRIGRVAAACVTSYCERLGIDERLFPRLRLLSWMVQASPSKPLFLLLATGELRQIERASLPA